MRILLLGFYYPPDISAGAFRAEALVTALERRLPQGSELHVITTMPNRHRHEENLLSEEEALPGGKVRITRLPVPGGGRGMASQVRAFASFAYQVRKRVREEPYDLVVSTSSRLMTAVLGAWVARRKNARLYQDIRDNFVENLPFVLPGGTGRLVAPFFGILERWALGRADRINLVSRGFEPYFRPRYPRQRFAWHTNGIDHPFVEAAESGFFDQKIHADESQPLHVLYAGNLGAGQGMELILPNLAERLSTRVAFTVIGAGAGREALCRALSERGIENVQVRDPVPREALLEAYYAADVLFLHLNTLPSLESVLPSKLFEYATTGRPIWAGLAGFPAQFVKEEIENAAVFAPGNVEAAVAALDRLELHCRPRPAFVAKWRRDKIMADMADQVLALVTNEA
ncbi:glycosyltransferase family 4 protein [Halomonas sp. LR3S48]|uniref:glycosyltransferase family 4 protein n=1 Tax=Halomonas sp. LR3S48 TaxID=2982694 RepID=UPI0021E49195|nr:glycosyltransferase family 4 protein [Halomonas sp. LR3S48]UYG01948.1 glycosyltransferase family 4 protein [Halomonas sp. LR3S48]